MVKSQTLWTERRSGQRFLITYSPLIFICMVTSGLRFLIMYSPLIFICIGCLAQKLKRNRKYTGCFFFFECTLNCTSSAMTPSINVFFNDVFITYFFECMLNCTRYRHYISLHDLTLEIHKISSAHNIDLYICWIPKEENKEADRLSKQVDYDDWFITKDLAKMLTNKWVRYQ